MVDGAARRLSPTGVTSFDAAAAAAADADGSLWHARVEAILHRPPGESPGKPGSPGGNRSGKMPSRDSPLQKKASRKMTRRHSIEGDLCPFRLLQLGLITELQHSPNGGKSPRPSHWPNAEAAEAAEAANPTEAAPVQEPMDLPSKAMGEGRGKPRRRHSMTEGPPPDYARLYLQRCAREEVPPPFASLQRRPYRRRSVETDCPVCPFKDRGKDANENPPFSLEELEPTKLARVPRELVVPRRISLSEPGDPGRPESPSTLSHASSISNVSSVHERKRAAARLPELKLSVTLPVLTENTKGSFQGLEGSSGSPKTPPHRKPNRRHSVDVSPFREFKSSWPSSDGSDYQHATAHTKKSRPSLGDSAPSTSSGNESNSLPRRPRFVAPRISPSEYGVDANLSGSSRSSSAKNCGANSGPNVGRPRRRATVDCAPGNLSSLRRPEKEQPGVASRSQHKSEATEPRRGSDRRPGEGDRSTAGRLVDGYLRKYLRLRERRRPDRNAQPESEESNLVEAPAEEKGAAKSTRRPSIGTPSTEAESTVPSLPHAFGEAERHIYIATGPGDLDVSALSSSDRCADIDADLETPGADRGAIAVMNERNVLRCSRRRASFAGLRGSVPDDDLGAERRGYERRKSGEVRCDAPLGRVDGKKERKGLGRRRASFDCQVPPFQERAEGRIAERSGFGRLRARDLSAERRGYNGRDAFQEEEAAEESAFLRQMFAEHDAFLDNVDRRYTRRRSVM